MFNKMFIHLNLISIIVLVWLSGLKTQVQYNINNTVTNNIDEINIYNNTITYNNYGFDSKNATKWLNNLLNKVRQGNKVNLIDNRQQQKRLLSLPESGPSTEVYTELERVAPKVVNNGLSDERDNHNAIDTPRVKQPSTMQDPLMETRYHESEVSSTSKTYLVTIKSTHEENVIIISDQQQVNLTNELDRVLDKCVKFPYNNQVKISFIDKCKEVYFATSTKIGSFVSNSLYQELAIELIMKDIIDWRYPNAIIEDGCLLESTSDMNQRIMHSLQMEISQVISKLSSQSARRRYRRHILFSDTDNDFIASLSKKSARRAIENMRNSGYLLSGEKHEKVNMLNHSTVEPSTISSRLNYTMTTKLRILKFPLLDWPEPLSVEWISRSEVQREGEYIHLVRAEDFLSLMPLCKSLPIWTYSGTYRKCINKLSIISISEGKLCRVAAECEGRLMNHYTCSSIEPGQVCDEATTVLTNHDSYGFTHSTFFKDMKLRSDILDLESVKGPYGPGNVRLCSITDLWKTNETCNQTLSYFGEVQFVLGSDGSVSMFAMPSYSTQLSFNVSDLNFYSCTSTRCLEKSTWSRCTGDKNYCSYVNHDCILSSPDQCHLIKNLVGMKLRESGLQVLSSFTVWANIKYEIIVDHEDEGVEIVDTGHELLYFQTGCNESMSCSGTNLFIRSKCPPIKLILRLGDLYTWFNLTATPNDAYTLEIPYSIVKGGSQPIVTLYGERGIIMQETTSCPISDVCFKIQCFLCLDKIVNPGCLTQSERSLIALVFLFAVLVIGGIVKLCLIYCIKSTTRSVKKVQFQKLLHKVREWSNREKLRTPGSEYKILRDAEGSKLRSVVVRSEHDDKDLKKDFSGTPNKLKVFQRRPHIGFSITSMGERPRYKIYSLWSLVLILNPITIVRCCSDSTTLSAMQSECIYDAANQKICKITNAIRISGPPVGQITCVNLMAPDGEIQGYISINILSNMYYCSRNTLYSTVQTKLVAKTFSHCPGSSQCPTWQACIDFLNSTEKKHSMFPNTVNKMSLFDCSTPGGCAGNGCARCDNGCSFLGAEFIVADDTAYDVFDCPSWIPHLSIRVSFHNLPGLNDFETTLIGSEVHEEGIIKIAKIADSVPINDNSFCLIRDDKRIYFSSCQKASELTSGSIGEVRCPNSDTALKLSDKCLFAQNMIRNKAVNWDFVTMNNQINIKEAIKNQKLPALHGTAIIDSLINGEIVMKNTQAETYEIQLTVKDLEITIRKERSTCFGQGLVICGCYSCMSGATLNVTLRATRNDTLGIISCLGLNSIPLSIGLEEKLYSMKIFVSTKIRGEGCTIKCSANTMALKADVHLTEQVMLNVLNSDMTISGATHSNSDFSKFFSSNLWLMIPTITVGSVFMIITIILCVLRFIPKPSTDTILPMSLLSKQK